MEGIEKERRRYGFFSSFASSHRAPLSPLRPLLFSPENSSPRSTRSRPRSPTSTGTGTCSRSVCEFDCSFLFFGETTKRERGREKTRDITHPLFLLFPLNFQKKKKKSSDLHSSLGQLAHPQTREGAAVDVPVELLAALDDGLAPDAFTVQVFRRANRSNQLSKGKAAAVAALRDALLSEAAVKFPEAARAYKEVLASSSAPVEEEEKKN